MAGKAYTSGDWIVKAGEEDAFVDEWTAFARWTLEHAPGGREFTLIRQANDPSHFVSFGAWESAEAVNEWRSSPEFSERLGRCRAHCDHFEAHDFGLSSRVGG
ncbi:MAG: antibiotic biosynthesis monooxygenase family protein [Gaiellaceae bacterium]